MRKFGSGKLWGATLFEWATILRLRTDQMVLKLVLRGVQASHDHREPFLVIEQNVIVRQYASEANTRWFSDELCKTCRSVY